MFLRVGEISTVNWRSSLDPVEGNCLGVHPPVGQMREARRLVFVFLSRENSINGISNGGSERENPCSRVKTTSGENPTAKNFDSRRLSEKGPVGKSACRFRVGKCHQRKGARDRLRVAEIQSMEGLAWKGCNG